MKYRTIKIPPGKGTITLEDAINAFKAVSSNGSHRRSKAKAAPLKSGVVNIPKSVGGSALKQSHSKPTAKAKTKRRLTTGKKATTKSVSAR